MSRYSKSREKYPITVPGFDATEDHQSRIAEMTKFWSIKRAELLRRAIDYLYVHLFLPERSAKRTEPPTE